MRTLNVREMRRVLGSLDEILEEVGEILLVRRGVPVARITPVVPARRPSHAALRKKIEGVSRSTRTVAEELRVERDSR